MAWVEQTNRRSQKAKHYYDSDTNKYRAEFGIHDLHYHDGSAWQDVDEGIVDDGADGFTKRNDKTRHQFRVASGGAYRWYPRRNVPNEYVDITEIQYYSNRWRVLNLPAAVWKQQSAEWDMANLYASITNTWKRIKTEFVLKNSSAYTRLRFAVAFTGLTYNHDTGEITSTTDGLVWGRIDKPTALDANEAPVTVTATYTDGWIEWNADTTGATYPISIDPTFTDGYGGDTETAKDTYVRDANPTTNYGTNAAIIIGDSNAAALVMRGLLQFTLSSIESTSTIESATFSMYNSTDYADNTRIFRVYRLKRAWVEAEATWNIYSTGNNWSTAGAFHADDCEQTDIGSLEIASDAAAAYKNWTLNTTAVAAMCNGGAFTNNGFLVKADTETDDGWGFRSSDNASTTTRPKLVVVYTAGAAGNPYYAYAQQ